MSFLGRFGKFEEICNSVKFFFQRGKKGYCDADLFEKTHTTGGWSPTPEAQECCDKGFELLYKHFFDLWW